MKGRGAILHISVNAYVPRSAYVPVGHVTIGLLVPHWILKRCKTITQCPNQKHWRSMNEWTVDIHVHLCLHWRSRHWTEGLQCKKRASCCNFKNQQTCWLRARIGLDLSALEPVGISHSFYGPEASGEETTMSSTASVSLCSWGDSSWDDLSFLF